MWLDTLYVLLMLTSVPLLGASRLHSVIRPTALQGVALSLLPFLARTAPGTLRAAGLAVLTMGLKGVVFPLLLRHALRNARVRREIEPLVGYALSLVVAIALLILAFWLAARLQRIGIGLSLSGLAAALFLIFSGLFLTVARRKALTQVLGFLVIENGIYLFGLSAVVDVHWLIELGVLLDVFVAVFIMGIAIHRISREFEHIDVAQLDQLKG